MAHYVTDGTCCCGPTGECCPATGFTPGCSSCELIYNIGLPSVFSDDCSCWNGIDVPVDQGYDIVLDEYYCFWETYLSSPTIPGCPDGIKTMGGFIECDPNTCEWVATVTVGTQGLYPCTEILIEARISSIGTTCPPTGAWPIVSWTWSSGTDPSCSPCSEIDLTGEDLIIS